MSHYYYYKTKYLLKKNPRKYEYRGCKLWTQSDRKLFRGPNVQ